MDDDNLGGDHHAAHAAASPSRIRRRRPHGPARPRLVEIGDPVTASAAEAVTPSDSMEGVDQEAGDDVGVGRRRRKGHGRRDHHGTRRRDGDDADGGDGGAYSSLALAAGAAGGSLGTSKKRKKTKTSAVSVVSMRLVVGGKGDGEGGRSRIRGAANGDNGDDGTSPGGAGTTSMSTSPASSRAAVSRAQSLGESSGDFGRWSSFGGNNGGNNDNAHDLDGGDGDDDGVVAMEEMEVVEEDEEEYPSGDGGGEGPWSPTFAAPQSSSHNREGEDAPHAAAALPGATAAAAGWAAGAKNHGFAPPHQFHPTPDPNHPTNNGYHHHPPGHVGHQQHHQPQHRQCDRQAVAPPVSAAQHDPLDEIIRMDVDVGPIPPLIVMDGANVAHSYASVRRNRNASSSNATPPFVEIHNEGGKQHKHEPDARGIRVAAEYFLSSGCRVVAVVPAHWITAKPRPGDEDHGNAMMKTPQLEALSDLKSRGILCCAPPTDDDDAYILAIARRADARARSRGDLNGLGGAYVLSCDLFRDAVAREHRLRKQQHQRQQQHRDGEVTAATMGLRKWLNGSHQSPPGRISFAFCDTGAVTDHWGEEGEAELDFVPNPRHPLIAELEQKRLVSGGNG